MCILNHASYYSRYCIIGNKYYVGWFLRSFFFLSFLCFFKEKNNNNNDFFIEILNT